MIEAVGDKIIVEEMKRAKSEGGIIIPEMVMEPQRYGKVLSIGPEVTEGIKIGDVVVCHPRGMQSIVLEKKILGVVKADEVYGKLSDDMCETLVTMEIGGVTEGEQIVKPASPIIQPVS